MICDYGIKAGYTARPNPRPFDDSPNADQYQDDVYAFAASLARPGDFIVDYGAGSGFKLRKYFLNHPCVAIDPNYRALVTAPRCGRWAGVISFPVALNCDVLICADVIEHFIDPDECMANIGGACWTHCIISTPDRARLVARGWCLDGGPPRNPCHAREWTAEEFGAYLQHTLPACGRYLHHSPRNPTTMVWHLTQGAA